MCPLLLRQIIKFFKSSLKRLRGTCAPGLENEMEMSSDYIHKVIYVIYYTIQCAFVFVLFKKTSKACHFQE